MVQLGNKPLAESPILTEFTDAIWHHNGVMGSSSLKKVSANGFILQKYCGLLVDSKNHYYGWIHQLV